MCNGLETLVINIYDVVSYIIWGIPTYLIIEVGFDINFGEEKYSHEPAIYVCVTRRSVVDDPVAGDVIVKILGLVRGLVGNYKGH